MNNNKITILIVDDNDDLLFILSDGLKEHYSQMR